MMGETHVRSGVFGGLCLLAVAAHGLGIVRPTDLLIFPAIVGGAALLPDWDHRTSTLTRSFPVVTVPVHWLLVWIHRLTYAATRRAYDPPSRTATGWKSAHRGITHSMVFAFVATLVTLYIFYMSPWWVVAVLATCLVFLAGDVVWAPLLVGAYALAGLYPHGINDLGLYPYGIHTLGPYIHSMSWLWAIGVGIGMACHNLGDCPTTQGVALFSPISWRPIVLPLTFRTGGWFETRVVKTVLMLFILYLQWVVHAGWLSSLLHAMIDPYLG